MLLLAGVAVLTAVTFLGQSNPTGLEIFPLRTSYSNRPNGTKALYLTFKELNFPVARSSTDFTRLPNKGRLLLVISPRHAVTPTEWAALKNWVAEGRTVCFGLEDQLVPEWAENAMESPDDVFAVHTALPAAPTALSEHVKELHFKGINRLDAQFYESLVARRSATSSHGGKDPTGKDYGSPDECGRGADGRCDDADT